MNIIVIAVVLVVATIGYIVIDVVAVFVTVTTIDAAVDTISDATVVVDTYVF